MGKFARKTWVVLLCAILLALSACAGPDGADSPSAQSSPTDHVEAPTAPESSAPPEVSEPPEASEPLEASEPPEATDPPASFSVEPSPSPEPSVPPKVSGLAGLGEAVEEDWFADAVFVGDSRTRGLELYSGIKSASFISYQGLSVFNIAKKECIDLDGAKVTALAALAEQECAKVYLMLGVNELGYNAESFRTAYTRVVEEIIEAQPDATVYLQTILPVNEAMAADHGISSAITNERVKLFNGIIADIAEEKETALVDVAALFWTGTGGMAKENTSDGVHLTRKGYVAWFEYLKSHTGTTPPVDEPVEFEPPVETEPEPAPSEPAASVDLEPEPSEPAASVDPEPEPSEPTASADPEPSQSGGEEVAAEFVGG